MSVDIEPMADGSFLYGDERIHYQRTQRRGDSSRVLIKVHPDCRVVVQAPHSASTSQVAQAVKKRSRWIYQQLRKFRELNAYITPRRYLSGESHYYLGKQYLLKVIEAPNQPQQVKLLRGRLEVYVRQKRPQNVQALLNQWYKLRAKEVFAKRLNSMLTQTLWVAEPPPLRLLSMKTQWGSCSPNGRLTLNPHLVKAPTACIDYVVLHELCHLAEHNHSDNFYRLMSQVMPGWEVVKARLDLNAAKFLQSAEL